MKSSQYSVFAHTTSPLTTLYRGILALFGEAKSQFILHLRPEEVLTRLREAGFHEKPASHDDDSPVALDRDNVTSLLDALCNWGNLRAYQDSSEVSTVEEFLRKRFLYQLTPEGEAAEEALVVYQQQLEMPGELQTAALEDIKLQLAALCRLAKEAEPDGTRTRSALDVLCRRFADLTSQAQRFMSGLQQQIDLFQIETSVFLSYKEMLIDYLNRFIRELVITTSAVASALQELEGQVPRLLQITVERELVDALNPTEEEREKRTNQWRSRWQGLRAWFISSSDRPSQAEELRSRALQAIPDLLSVVAAINERRATRGDRMADLCTLARWFAECENDDGAHQLWRAAFGIYPSRHLRVNSDTLATWEDEQVKPGVSWVDAPGLMISPRLRQYGSTKRRGNTATVIDRTREKRELADMVAREAKQLQEARQRLMAKQPVLLSELHELEPLEFDLFFDLLTRALANKRGPMTRGQAQSTDGSMEVLLEPMEDARTTTVHTRFGRLTVQNHRMTIRDLFASMDEAASQEVSSW